MIGIIHRKKENYSPVATGGSIRPYFNFDVVLDFDSLEETVQIYCVRDDEEPVPVGDRFIKIRDLIN